MLGEQPWVERCLSARTGDEALALARRYEPHVALVDLFLGAGVGRGGLRAPARGLAQHARAADLGRRAHLAQRRARRGRGGLRLQGLAGAPTSPRAVRMVGLGMTVFEPARGAGRPPLTDREREVLDLDRRRARRTARSPSALLLSPAHGQGAHERAVSQARACATGPRRCRARSGSGCSPDGARASSPRSSLRLPDPGGPDARRAAVRVRSPSRTGRGAAGDVGSGDGGMHGRLITLGAVVCALVLTAPAGAAVVSLDRRMATRATSRLRASRTNSTSASPRSTTTRTPAPRSWRSSSTAT